MPDIVNAVRCSDLRINQTKLAACSITPRAGRPINNHHPPLFPVFSSSAWSPRKKQEEKHRLSGLEVTWPSFSSLGEESVLISLVNPLVTLKEMKAARLSTAQGLEKINCWSSAVSVRTAQDFGPELSTHFNFYWTPRPYPRKQALEDFGRQAGNEQVRMMSSATASLQCHCQAQARARDSVLGVRNSPPNPSHSQGAPCLNLPASCCSMWLQRELPGTGFPQGGAPVNHLTHLPQKKGRTDIIPNNRAGVIYSPSLHYKK